MKLAIITSDGSVYDVQEDLQDFNLDKPMASAHVMENVRDSLTHLRDIFETRCQICKAGSPGTCTGIQHVWVSADIRIKKAPGQKS